MIVDSSALIAILKDEPEADPFLAILARPDPCRMSAANWVEAAIVADNSPSARDRTRYDNLIDLFDIEIVSVTPVHAELARAAYRVFGRGNHEAALNFGDCFAYGLAKSEGRPLLFKGNDFSKTDIIPALPTG